MYIIGHIALSVALPSDSIIVLLAVSGSVGCILVDLSAVRSTGRDRSIADGGSSVQ